MIINKKITEKILDGDHQLLTDLISNYASKVKAIVTPIVGIDNAQDVIQEAWISVIKHLGQFKGDSSFNTWLYRIFINQAKMFLRKPIFQDLPEDENQYNNGYFNKKGHWIAPPNNWHVESPQTHIHLIEFEKEIYNFLSKLPNLQSSLLMMHDIEQIKFSDICNILDISASNGRVLLHRARTALYKHIDLLLETK